jgi:AcrR family transcriptional regulator
MSKWKQAGKSILNAFWKLYHDKRIEKITVKEITNIAGYNRSTFYQYFDDVYDVLDYLEDTLLSEIKEVIVNSFASPFDSREIHKIAELYDEKGEYLSILLSEKGDPYFVKKFKDIMKPVLYANFSVSDAHVNAAYIVEFAISAILGTLMYWYQHKNDISSEEIVMLIRSMLAKGTLQEMQKLGLLTFVPKLEANTSS